MYNVHFFIHALSHLGVQTFLRRWFDVSLRIKVSWKVCGILGKVSFYTILIYFIIVFLCTLILWYLIHFIVLHLDLLKLSFFSAYTPSCLLVLLKKKKIKAFSKTQKVKGSSLYQFHLCIIKKKKLHFIKFNQRLARCNNIRCHLLGWARRTFTVRRTQHGYI